MERKPPYKPRPMPPPGTDYRSEWNSMKRSAEAEKQPRSQDEFNHWVQQAAETTEERNTRRVRELAQRSRRSVDSEEEDEIFYPPTGYSGEWVFWLLRPSNPTRARRRVERVYWLSWHSFAYGLFLSGFGIMLLTLGGIWTYYGEERIRGVGVLTAAVLLCIPGFYSLFVLFMYVRGVKGYSYRQLPED